MKYLSFLIVLTAVLLLPDTAISAGRKKVFTKKRKKVLSSEKVRSKSETTLSFEEVDIRGKRKVPAGSVILKTLPDYRYKIVKIRTSWRKEMNQTTRNLRFH